MKYQFYNHCIDIFILQKKFDLLKYLGLIELGRLKYSNKNY